MLQGLGRSLRSCGVDTLILENNQDHMECVRLAQDQHRYILTRGTAFRKVKLFPVFVISTRIVFYCSYQDTCLQDIAIK